MSVVFNAVSERGAGQTSDCVAIANSIGALDRLATTLGVTPLGEFIGGDPSDWLDEAQAKKLRKFGDAQWFSAKEGLQTVRSLIRELTDGAGVLVDRTQLLGELKDYERFLAGLEEKSVRWRIAVMD